MTHALYPSSPARDAGNPAFSPPPAYDVRGEDFPRVVNGRVDIGAVENQPSDFSFQVTKTADTADGVCSESDCSLREAISAANLGTEENTVLVPAGLYVLTLTGDSGSNNSNGDLDIRYPVMIVGEGKGQTVIQGMDDRVIEVLKGAKSVTISDLTMKDGEVYGSGGCIAVWESSLNLDHVGIHHCIAHSMGGGIYFIDFSEGELFDVEVTECEANEGGGIYIYEGNLDVDHSVIAGNTAGSGGGGLYNYDGELVVSYSRVIENQVNNNGSGGGLLQVGTSAYFATNNSEWSKNVVDVEGGGIFLIQGSGAITSSTISGNTALAYGGGVNTRVPLSISYSTIAENVADYDENADGSGGGLFTYQPSANLTISHTILANNINVRAPGNADCFNYGNQSTITSLGYNLIEVQGSCVSFTPDVGDVIGIDPDLGGLKFNGGPTRTHALLLGSAAINAGNPALGSPPAYDQRGYARILYDVIDIGAYERDWTKYLPLIFGKP